MSFVVFFCLLGGLRGGGSELRRHVDMSPSKVDFFIDAPSRKMVKKGYKQIWKEGGPKITCLLKKKKLFHSVNIGIILRLKKLDIWYNSLYVMDSNYRM